MQATLIVEYCVECGEVTDFTYDGEQWMCLNCGSYNSQGGFSETDSNSVDDGSDDRSK